MLLSAALLLLASYVHRSNLFTLGSSLPTSAAADVIDTGYAKYLGNRSYPNTVAYLGIPYAEPPLDERRFRAPLPLNKARISLESKGQVVDATKYPEFCIQGTTGSGDAGGAGSEDCLKVNIYAPVGAKKGSNLPVLVYIHGGGYIYGNPANWPFDHWINQSPNVVIVSVYYRLSAFGFLATPAFSNPANGNLNAGFLDQIQALEWIQENIASFGGNPAEVTINGESAGGSSIELHLVANEGQKLFRSAIAQSVYRTPLPTPEQQEGLFNFFANHTGCGSGSVTTQLACLRKVSVSALAIAQDVAYYDASIGSGYNLFHPVIDGKVLTDFPTKSILAGKFAKVPLIVGATTNETLSGGDDIDAAMKTYFPSITDADISALLDLYPLSDFASSEDLQFQTLTGDSELRCARSILGSAFGKATGKSWTYRYNQATPGAAAVYHASENWMMFRGTSTGLNGTTTFQTQTPTQRAFAEELIAYWLSFVRSGNPNTFKLGRSPKWTSFTSKSSRIVLTQGPGNTTTVSGSTLEVESSTETARCNLVASQVSAQEN
ncbi:alpha/beta-hydrolase [Gymnopilus junonius]|uniref:Carboxylic ester hydrolase n=1 Tax=Gymnopilus junonius TaxID=109634 RepID=A0A9P5NSD0_GYMJU|nr:alpha/beta-hydrolase [Gymnopilus junonius]